MTTTIESTAAATTTRLTYDDYCQLPDDGKRYEIIDGELYVNPAPARKHQIIAGNLHGYIWQYTKHVRSGTVYIAPFDVILSEHEVVQPDVLFLTSEHMERVHEHGLDGAPDLVIEILSPSSRDRDLLLKRKRYAHFGVQEYWIVDPDAESVAVYRLDRGLLKMIETPEPLTSPLLPGFSLALRDVFAE
ncbi:MAG: Uma2 family endonuclease [Thermoanaerobaculia bacterium]